MKSCGIVAATGLLCATIVTPAHPQTAVSACEGTVFSEMVRAPLRPGILCGMDLTRQEARPEVAKAFLYSLVIPGAGQRSLGQKRGLAYLALEAIAWVEFARARSDGGRLRDEYRTLGWDFARTFDGARIDGDFQYYETLTKFARSGAFDADMSTVGIQPESDPGTFNGSIWALAMDIFFSQGSAPGPGDPSFERALDFYRDRGYGEEFLWDWTGNTAEQGRFGRLIRESDNRFHRSSVMAGVLLGNHLVSALDAFLSARVLAATSGVLDLNLRAVPVGGTSTRLDVGIVILR